MRFFFQTHNADIDCDVGDSRHRMCILPTCHRLRKIPLPESALIPMQRYQRLRQVVSLSLTHTHTHVHTFTVVATYSRAVCHLGRVQCKSIICRSLSGMLNRTTVVEVHGGVLMHNPDSRHESFCHSCSFLILILSRQASKRARSQRYYSQQPRERELYNAIVRAVVTSD